MESIGTDSTYESYRGYWANLSNTPFRLYKTHTTEGGIRTRFIVSWPGHIQKTGEILDNQPVHIIDLAPTFVSLAKAEYPKKYQGKDINPLNGQNILPVFIGQQQAERTLYWEHQGNKAVREGKWKLMSRSTETVPYEGVWELYDLDNDKTELVNLASKYPEKVKELAQKWVKRAENNHFYPINGTDLKESGKLFTREH